MGPNVQATKRSAETMENYRDNFIASQFSDNWDNSENTSPALRTAQITPGGKPPQEHDVVSEKKRATHKLG
jgi:hypothetical protein